MKRTVPHDCQLICTKCHALIYDRGRSFDKEGRYLLFACEHLVSVVCDPDDVETGYLDIVEDDAGKQWVCREMVNDEPEDEDEGKDHEEDDEEASSDGYCGCPQSWAEERAWDREDSIQADIEGAEHAVYFIDDWTLRYHIIMTEDVLKVIGDFEE